MGNLVGLGQFWGGSFGFFGGLGVFFMGIGVLWFVSIYKETHKGNSRGGDKDNR